MDAGHCAAAAAVLARLVGLFARWPRLETFFIIRLSLQTITLALDTLDVAQLESILYQQLY